MKNGKEIVKIGITDGKSEPEKLFFLLDIDRTTPLLPVLLFFCMVQSGQPF